MWLGRIYLPREILWYALFCLPFCLWSLFAMRLGRQRRLRWPAAGVVATAAFLVLFLPVRAYLYTPCSMDDNVGGITIFLEFLMFGGIAGIFHLLLSLWLLDGAFGAGSQSRTTGYALPTENALATWASRQSPSHTRLAETESKQSPGPH